LQEYQGNASASSTRIVVDMGEMMNTSQKLAQVGNSGNTTEPRLSIHAVEDKNTDVFSGDPVPIFLEGCFPTRNSIF